MKSFRYYSGTTLASPTRWLFKYLYNLNILTVASSRYFLCEITRAETNTQFVRIFAWLHKYLNTKRVFRYTLKGISVITFYCSSNCSDIRLIFHSNYSNPKFHIHFSPRNYLDNPTTSQVSCQSECYIGETWVHTVLALLFTRRYFHEFHEKVAFRENIIVNSCASVALLHLKQSAS